MSITTPPARPERRARRRILGWGALAVGVVAVAGAVEGIPRAERDLERRVETRLVANGVTGVHVSFSGQDGTLRCDTPLDDPTRAEHLAEGRWGVRIAEIDQSCIDRNGAATGDTGATDTTVNGGSSAPTTGTTDVAATTTSTTSTTSTPGTTDPTTTEAPTTEAGDDGGSPALGDVAEVAAEFVDGRLVLTGTVADEAARAALVEAAGTVVAPANVDDQLVIAGTAGAAEARATAADLGGLTDLVALMPPNLVEGLATRKGDGSLTIEGTYADDAGRDAVQAAADDLGAEITLGERAEATASDAARLADELNAFVAANPILFEPNQATLTPAANATIDQVAAIANRYAGVSISIIGHTDSDGDAGRNLVLSAARAETVRNGLGERGVTAPLTTDCRGETEPIVVGGVEDKTASRRVVFDVAAS